MKPKNLYLMLCVLGTILPYTQLMPFLRDHGLDMRLFVHQLFANQVSGFFGMDVVVSSIVLWLFIRTEGGLPLFLYHREMQLERSQVVV